MKKVISLLLAAVLLLGMLPVAALAAGTAPEADSNGVYQIGTASELLWFAEAVNGGDTGISGVLTADIDLTGTDWPGIGNSDNRFAGSFDGQGHTVTFKAAEWGLFGYVKGTESALASVSNVRTAGSINSSGIAHDAAYASFTNCINGATITADSSEVAGIVGGVSGENKQGYLYTDVQIKNCGNEASVSGYNYVAGILGYSNSNTRLDGCYNTGNIHGNENVGGVVGYLQESRGVCEVKNSYNTGKVTGSTNVGGIIGNMYNGVAALNCYNAGDTTYAIAGHLYNNTATIQNCYFQGTKSAKSVPDYVYVDSAEIATRADSRSASEMAGAEFAELLGASFQQSCPTPVLTWQTAVNHTGADCGNCALGTTEKEQYAVSVQPHDGYTMVGDETATQDSAYTFNININEGYEKDSGTFTVKVNGEEVTPASNGSYTVYNVSGPLSVTVFGVQLIPDTHAIKLPAEGYGYRVIGNATAARDKDYTFTVNFADGFTAGDDFKVIAQEIVEKDQTPNELELSKNSEGVYTIPTVQKDYRILISGVKVVSKIDPINVNFSITEGFNEFHLDPKNENMMLDQTITVPYFDLSLYGLERYYYNPYCYVDEEGNPRGTQQVGTPESAYDKITAMHAFIVATELYWFEYEQSDVGMGTSYKEDPAEFAEAISWTQGVGSSFMDFWEHGTNMNYYVNYAYPLGAPGWGATSDQVLIEDGDVISLHLITGSASGSRFGFFAVNDADGNFTAADTIDAYEVDQGEKIDLTLYWTTTTADYSTGYETIAGKGLYWIEEGEETADITMWNATKLGETALEPDPGEEDENPVPVMCTNNKGVVTVSTVGVAPGTYYIAAPGGWTAGGAVDNAGFTSSGGEAGPAVFKLTVNPYEGKLGDVNNDTQITGIDATLVSQYVAKLTSEVNEAVADVNGDGVVTGVDATLISQYVAKLITVFPAEQTN